jgi:hypothetical protein
MDNSIKEWLEESKNLFESNGANKGYVVLNDKEMDIAFFKAFDETIKLPQFQQLLERLSKQ